MNYSNDDDQPERAQPGHFGAANTQSYTYPFQVLLMSIAFFFVHQDLKPDGSGFLRVAFGIESNFWIWVWIFFGFMFTNGGILSFASSTYYRITGRTFLDDRIGYAHAGGQDLAFWVGNIPLGLFIYVFGTYVPVDMLSWGRPFALVFAASIIATFVGRRLVLRVYASTLKQWMYVRRYS